MGNSTILSLLAGKIASFNKIKVLVVGDIVADQYILGMTSRVSREAPVLILKYDSEETVPGGAGNAVANIKALGGCPVPVSAVGNDEMGRRLLETFRARDIDTSGIVVSPRLMTATKTRILAGGHNTTKQQVIRIDREPAGELPKGVAHDVLATMKRLAPECQAVIVSDYGLGVVSDEVIEFINDMAKRDKKALTIDTRHRLLRFKNATAVTPNEEEVEEALQIKLDDENIEEAGHCIIRETGCRAALITRGRKGMDLFERDGKRVHIDIFGTDQIADVTGAGDTVISTFTLALAAGFDMESAARIANCAAGIVVTKRGTATVSQEELVKAISAEKFLQSD